MGATQRNDGGVYLSEGGWGEGGFLSVISQQGSAGEPPGSVGYPPAFSHSHGAWRRFLFDVGFEDALIAMCSTK